MLTDTALYRVDDPAAMDRIPHSSIASVDFSPASGGIAELIVSATSEGVESGHPLSQFWYVSDRTALGLTQFFANR